MTKLSKEDYNALEKYYDEMMKIVANQSCSGLKLKMKNDVISILSKYNINVGCSKCGSGIVRMFTLACQLFAENKQERNSKKKVKKNG